MTDKDVKTYLNILKEDIWEDDGYGVATQDHENEVQAINRAITAVEVVEKIKKAFISRLVRQDNVVVFNNANDTYFTDAVYHILCDAYGTEKSSHSWMKEYEE